MPCPATTAHHHVEPAAHVDVVDPGSGRFEAVALYNRRDLPPGATIAGPALIVEDETTTMVTRRFRARIDALGSIVLTRT